MKKRVLAIMLACLMLVSLPLSALATETHEHEQSVCPGEGNNHYLSNCEYTLVEKDCNTKCGEYNYNVYACNECGDNFAADFVLNENHAWQETTPAVAPTHDDAGTTAVETCSICGATRGGDVDPALGHNHVAGELEGSCATGWTITYTCACGDSYTVSQEGPGHVWEEIPEITLEPTLTDDGIGVYECLNCDATKEVPVKSHDCNESLLSVEEVPAACGKTGVAAHDICTVCEKLYIDGVEVNAEDLITEALVHGHAGLIAIPTQVVLQGSAFRRLAWDCLADGVYTFETNSSNFVYLYNRGQYMGPGSFNASTPLTVELKAGESYDFYGWSSYTVTFTSYEYVAGPIVTEGDCDNLTVHTYACEKCNEQYELNVCGFCGKYIASDVLADCDLADVDTCECIAELQPNHDWELTDSLAPTCDKWGFNVWGCTECGYIYTEQLEPNGHNLGLVYGWEADCWSNSYYYYECSDCDYSEEVVGDDMLEHVVVSTKYPATCCTYAYTTNICELCGSDFGTEEHVDEGYNDEAHAKVEGEDGLWINYPTCTESGNWVYRCLYCNDYVAEKVPALGHDYVEYERVATCREVGYKYNECAVCGDWYIIDGTVNGPIVDREEEMAKADGYSLKDAMAIHQNLDLENSKPYREGSCTIVALDAYWCWDCQTYILVADENSGCHEMPGDLLSKDEAQAGETAMGTIIGGDGIYGSGNPLIISGMPYVVEQRPYDDLTYAYTATEDITFAVKVEGTGFAMYGFSMWNMYNYFTDVEEITLLAGETIFFNIWNFNGTITLGTLTVPEYSAQEPTCGADGWTAQYYCDRCGELVPSEVLPATGNHTMIGEDACETEAWCEVCGLTIDDVHHNYEAVVTAPTCEDAGYTTYTCSICGDSYIDDVVDALGHAWEITNMIKNENFIAIYDIDGYPIGIQCIQQFGYDFYHCTTCGDNFVDGEYVGADYIKNYDPIDCYHSYVEDFLAYIDPTCSELGKVAFYCEKCQNPDAPGFADYFYIYDLTSELVDHVNENGDILTNDCSSKDITDRACIWCCYGIDEEGEQIVIDTIDWDHSNLQYVEYEATCCKDAYDIKFCNDCGYYEVVEEYIGTATGVHIYEVIDYVAPTYTTEGYTVYACVYGCGDSYTEYEDAIDGIGYFVNITNNSVEGATLTYGSQIAVTITMSGLNKEAWGFEFDVDYNSAVLEYAGYEAAFEATVVADKGDVIAVMGNTDDGFILNGEETVITLYFNVLSTEIENGSISVVAPETLGVDNVYIESDGDTATYETAKFMDVNVDGDVDMRDALQIYNLVMNDADYSAVADVNQDGSMDAKDIIALYNHLINE